MEFFAAEIISAKNISYKIESGQKRQQQYILYPLGLQRHFHSFKFLTTLRLVL